MTSSLTLHIYNLNYKLPIKHLKKELYNLFTRVVKDVMIKMYRRYPGEAWVKFDSKKDLSIIKELFNNFFFLDRKILIEKANKEMLEDAGLKTILIKNLNSETFTKLKDILNGFDVELRYVEVKKVAFVNSKEAENVLSLLKNNDNLKKCTCEFSK